MPRLSSRLYLERCRFLRTAWLQFPTVYTVLSINRQWDVHAFYKPSEALTETERLEHRKAITEQRPGLPAKASRSFNVLYQTFRRAYANSNGNEERFREAVHPKHREIRVYALARPEPDLKQLARALLELAKEQLAEEQSNE